MTQMYYVFGLGNPGKEYQHTRHNAGFICVESLARMEQTPAWRTDAKFSAEVSESSRFRLYKPLTFMNDSGRSVRKVLDYFCKDRFQDADVEFPELFVMFDDLDLEVGSWKLQFGRGPKIHNGLTSIYQHLHTEKFWHVRLGVDGRGGDRSIPASDYVLTGFPPAEQTLFDTEITHAAKKIFQQP
jgi:PTH1 family peptidyl-tRNA hydrolase